MTEQPPPPGVAGWVRLPETQPRDQSGWLCANTVLSCVVQMAAEKRPSWLSSWALLTSSAFQAPAHVGRAQCEKIVEFGFVYPFPQKL